MNISAETYIVISLMFAVFAAVAAVGTSVVLGAGFERLRAGFELVKRQSGFFSDAIYKLDQRTQKLSEETAQLKSGAYSMGERMTRVEKQTTFMAEAVNSIEQRILQGTPAQPQEPVRTMPSMHSVSTITQRPAEPRQDLNMWVKPPVQEQQTEQPKPFMTPLFRDYPEEAPKGMQAEEINEAALSDLQGESQGLTTLLARYFTGESSGSGRGVVYH